jgi:hypothetical protein
MVVAGWVLGAITGVFPVPSLIAFAVLAFGVFLTAYRDRRREEKRFNVNLQERIALLSPSHGASNAATKTGLNLLTVGNVIELQVHPNVNSSVRADGVGWPPEDIRVDADEVDFDASELLSGISQLSAIDPPNNIKYSLVNTPFVTEESSELQLELKETNYQIIETAKAVFKEDKTKYEKLGSVIPSDNRIPNSLCLHYTVRFSNGDILCMKRAAELGYHKNAWSISGEEQISERDVHADNPIKSLFVRALCEELLHLGGESHSKDLASEAMSNIKYMRVYSIVVEWPLYNPAICGFVQLNLDPDEFRSILSARKIGLVRYGQEDREGAFFVLNSNDALPLLEQGQAMVSGLFNGNPILLTSSELHPSSRYRLFRFLRAYKRGELKPS